MYYPQYRPRRMRKTDSLRAMIRETHLQPHILVYPLFVIHGEDVRNPVSSMPGVHQLSINHLIEEAKECAALGIRSVLLFGIPDVKDEAASSAYDPEGIVQLAIRALKEHVPQLTVIADVCLCEYMSHGHCGVVREDGCIDNDLSVELLAKTALSYAEAGVDVVAPSDMMDGRISAIRAALDNEGYSDLPIFSYSTKYASSFYGPFREAAESPPQFGDRKSYQMDPANTDEGVREAMMDIEEGADMVMVKPAMPYLDLIYRVKTETRFPVAAYNVSGEYAMVKAAAANGWLDEKAVVMETLLAIKRAGADIIITYHAKDAARWLAERVSAKSLGDER
ncbi:MAG: porphobilinogen synthase [Thermoleophilia bacterium]|nr:porphobilinogen synthase [Thermoleophilia bacterium]